MKRFSDRSSKHKATISCLFVFAVCFLLLPIQTVAQTKITSFQQLMANRVRGIQVSFTYSPTNPRTGQEVQFTDTSQNGPISWQWNFGDGSTSTAQNPSHAFAKSGFYRISLIAANKAGSKSRSRTISVSPVASTVTSTTPAASFKYSPLSPVAGNAVQFTDTSTNSPTSWQWHFGDGMISSAQNPTHPYGASGLYIVTLDANNSSGTKTASQMLTVTASSTPTASFTFSPTSPVAGQAVQFTDTSMGSPTSWQWNFGDGATSTSQSPSHIYASSGSYTVTLTATNSSGSQSANRTVTVVPALTPSFTFTPTSPAAGQAVQFTDTSTGSPTSWQWNFGDGASSTSQNPSHTFATAASYTVSLTATNSSGSKSITRTITIVPALTASFTYSPASPGVGQAVQFTDTSTGSPTSWQWDFGDSTSSTSQNPSHAYTTAGSYLVTLTIRAGSSLNNTSKTIIVGQSLKASFTYSPTSPLAGQAVQFTDTSTGSPTSWQWSFGDNGTSTSQNPKHTFSTAGSYAVTLTATNGSGSQSSSLTVTVAPAASFTYSPSSPVAGQAVQFTDTSTGSPKSWQWSFGDGATSTVQNPSHTFTAVASYTVTLTVSGSGSNSASHTINVSPATSLMADFTFSPSSPNPSQAVQFTDASTGSPTSWQWSFGDGATSTAQNPSHAFTTADLYIVTLAVANTSGSNSVSRTISVSSASSSIPSDRLIDWSKAGVWDVRTMMKGIPVYPVVIDLTGLLSYGGYNLDSTGVSDSRNAIQAALNACPAYGAVLLGPGSYLISSGGISIPSYKVLRGTEPFTVTPQTTLIHSHLLTSNVISISSSPVGYTPVVNVVSCAKGSDTITVDSVTGFTVGDDVFIDELNDPDFVSIGGTEQPCTWCSRLSGARSLNEVKRIKAINSVAKTIQFERPVYRTYWNSPQLVRDVAASSLKINAGVESLRITTDGTPPSSDLTNAIDFYHATYCWVKRVEVYNEYYKAILLQYYNLGCEVRECYVHGVPSPTYSVSGNYSIALADHNTDCLVENNICYHIHSTLTLGSGGSTANVIAYNYAYNYYHNSSPTWFIGGTGHHGAHPYMNLWEGNYIRKIFHDVIQGGSSHTIWFRNRATGMPINSSEPGSAPAWPTINQEMAVCNLPTFSYYVSIIGNILGTSGYDTVYETYPEYLATKQIWKLGFTNQNGEGNPTDPKTAATLIRHGNYDYVTHSTIWDTGISDHSLPNSLYLTAKPSFFGALSWPAFGPDLNPMESYIPAKYRFDAGTYFAGPPTK